MTPDARPAAPVEIRAWGEGDDVSALTALLHRAYRVLGERGLNYTAVDQDDATTRSRIAGNECWVALLGGALAGTVTLHTDGRDRPPCAQAPDTAYVSQLAADPAHQGAGLGTRLLAHAEERARGLGFRRVALDTAEPAEHLVAFYERRGYRTIGRTRFTGKTYGSVVMAKDLAH